MKITLTKHNHDRYAASWRTDEARYHMWLSAPGILQNTLTGKVSVIYKNPLVSQGELGYFLTRYLNPDAKANQSMRDAVLAIGQAAFDAADAAFEQKEAARRAKTNAEARACDLEDLTRILNRWYPEFDQSLLGEAVPE